MIYQNKETGGQLTEADMVNLYHYYIDNGLIDDNGLEDFISSATDSNGLYISIKR